MIYKKFRFVLVALVIAAFSVAGCGDDGGSGGGSNTVGENNPDNNTENNDENNTPCEDECSVLDSKRCDGTVIETCRDVDGCKVWEAGVDCATADKVCDPQGDLAECVGGAGETCDDGVQNQNETDIDCGGSCDPCEEGQQCETAADCDTGNCDADNSDLCVDENTETCTDGTQNQDETDVDCGGAICGACEVDEQCTASSDCLSGYCDTNNGTCLADAPSCDDGVQNQDETDVDCGGSSCGACAEGDSCTQASDCSTNNCDSGNTDQCVAADVETCSDGVQNQDETDVDCGGSNCSSCALDATCNDHDDCASGVCDFTNTGTCIDADPQYEVNEDFETGDFSLFPYVFESSLQSDPNHWEIETDAANCHDGNHCMRTNFVHAQEETTSVSVSLSVRQDTQITFWAKTKTEVDEHFFRFYIDGVQQLELSGENDWTLHTFNVPATGPNGPDRTFTWEYSRSDFMHPDHTPWNQVWVDDINMPDWNTEPTTPEQLAPWNGKLTIDRTPTFRWRSYDPDFDTITYEMEYDTDPNFSDPVSTGETNDTQFTPPADLDDQTAYYWRVRAKDDNNYRWSDWSPTWAVEVDSTYEYAAAWRQSTTEQFDLNDIVALQTAGDQVTTESSGVSVSDSTSFSYDGANVTLNFSNLPQAAPGSSISVDMNADADLGSSSEYGSVSIESTSLGTISGGECGVTSDTYSTSNAGSYVNDGQTTVSVNFSSGVNTFCANTVSATINYSTSTSGTMTSEPIDFGMFEGKAYWEKVQWAGSGNVTIQILDEAGNLIPDTAVPGNSAGLTRKSIHLWHLDPAQYPKIRLQASLSGNATIDEWRVVANDVYEWTFSYDGDTEGWEAKDHLATPTSSVTGGAMRVESQAAGDDPRVEYWFDEPIDAADFTTIEVRVRTSNNYNNDDVTLYWDSNFGSFDARRSFVESDIFLLNFQDIVYDLTVVPTSPNEPWQGQINSIRIDPVERFWDQAGTESDGWFEIERIRIY